LVAAEVIQLGIVGGRADLTHLLGGALGIPLALTGTSALARHPHAALRTFWALSLAYILITDLRPYTFAEAKPIGLAMFIPLIHHYRDIDVMQLWNILEAMLVYLPFAAAAYALDPAQRLPWARVRWPSATRTLLACAAVALATESAQLWIVGRTPGLEDVLYALCGAYLGVSLTRLFLYAYDAAASRSSGRPSIFSPRTSRQRQSADART
jgi:VanZ family protein